MNFLSDLNNDQFLKDAFDAKCNEQLIKAARLRRNIYFALFVASVVCICITTLINALLLSALTVGLAALSLVLMSKYSTQVLFLRTLKLRTDLGEDAVESDLTE